MSSKTDHISVRIDDKMGEVLRARAEAEDLSIADIVRRWMRLGCAADDARAREQLSKQRS